MNNVKLMTVEDRFVIQSRGVVLIPDFPVPTQWTDRTEPVTIVSPNGNRISVSAMFMLTHYSYAEPRPGQSWRIVILVPDLAKEDIPIGSVVFTAPETRDLLAPEPAT